MYLVRYYPRKFRFFLAFKHFVWDWAGCQLPALTPRFMSFLRNIPQDQKITVYDPSSGWGGRILTHCLLLVPYTTPHRSHTDNHNITGEVDGEVKTQSRYEWLLISTMLPIPIQNTSNILRCIKGFQEVRPC